MKVHPRAKLVLLILPPLAGCVAVAWLGSQRPERQIVGKWRVEGKVNTIQFREDGTYDARGWRDVYKEGEPITATSLQHRSQYHARGVWYFSARNHLVLNVSHFEGEGQLRPIYCASDALNEEDEMGGNILIQGNVARVVALGQGGSIWKRIESPVND